MYLCNKFYACALICTVVPLTAPTTPVISPSYRLRTWLSAVSGSITTAWRPGEVWRV